MLPFTSSLIASILNGSKTCTYRYGLKYNNLQVGEVIDIINSNTDEIVVQAIVTDKYQTIFKDLPLSTDGHQEYGSYEDMRNNFSRYYGEISDDDVFLVIQFQIRNEEDLEMIKSPSYKKQITESRKSGKPIPAEDVW